MARRSAAITLLGIAAAVVVIDQLTKAWALADLRGQPPVEVLGDWLQWSFATNSGAAFSLGRGNAWIFTIFSAVVIVAILVLMRRVVNMWWAVALGLVLGGGLGNFIDRLIREPGIGQGHVVDFIAVPNWPVFNVADMAVVAGAVLAVALSLLGVDYGRAGKQEGDAVPVGGEASGAP